MYPEPKFPIHGIITWIFYFSIFFIFTVEKNLLSLHCGFSGYLWLLLIGLRFMKYSDKCLYVCIISCCRCNLILKDYCLLIPRTCFSSIIFKTLMLVSYQQLFLQCRCNVFLFCKSFAVVLIFIVNKFLLLETELAKLDPRLIQVLAYQRLQQLLTQTKVHKQFVTTNAS